MRPSFLHVISRWLRGIASHVVGSVPMVPFIVASSLLLVAAMSGILAVILHHTYRDAIIEAENRLEDYTGVLAEHAALVFEEVDRTLQAANRVREKLMHDGQWGPGAGDVPFRMLSVIRLGSAAASNLSWTDENGERLYTAILPWPSPLNLSDRRYFQAHRDDAHLGVLVDAPNLSQATGRYLVPVSRRFDLPDGSFGGITTALIDPAYFSKFYQTTTRRQKMNIQLTALDGAVVVREPQVIGLMGTSVAGGALFTRHLPKAPSGVYRAESIIDGVDRIVAYKTVAKFPLVISMSMDSRDALADWYQDTATLLISYGALVLLIASGAGFSIWQIGERARRQREQAEANEKLRQIEKQQALGTMIGGIAHEINNALLPIAMLCDMTEDELPEGSYERENVGQIRNSAGQIEALIKRVLVVSREEQITSQRLELEPFTADVMEALKRKLPKNIDLVSRIEPGVGAVAATADKLNRVFVDLVNNAAQAIGDQPGRIEIAAERAFQGKASSGTEFVRFRVTDDGPGIPPIVRQRLFEPFFTTKEAGKGVGLGLYSARRVITELGGHLDVESELGKGACFSILLPRLKAEAPVLSEAA